MTADPVSFDATRRRREPRKRGRPGIEEVELPFEVDLEAIRAMAPDRQEEALAQLDAFRHALAENPLWRFKPHLGEQGRKLKLGVPLSGSESRGQVEYLELDALDVYIAAVIAGNRFGKTHINVARCAIQTLPEHFIPPWLLPYKTLDPADGDVRFILAGPDSTNWQPKVLLPKLRELLPAKAMWKGSVDAAFNEKTRILRFDDGSYWNVLTYDMELKAWSGQEADGVCFDEEPAGPDGYRKYEEAVGRIVDRDGTIRFTLTPVEGLGWLYELLSDADEQPRRDEEVHVVSGTIDDNPNISDRGRERAKTTWSKNPATADARIRGLWTHREGLIFPEFSPTLERPPGEDSRGGHYRADRELRAPHDGATGYPVAHSGQWLVPVFETIDPGINDEHPFAFSVSFLNSAATDVYGIGDVLETFFAIKEPNFIVADHCELIKEARAQFGYQPTFTTIDPAAKNRNPETGKHLIDAYRKHGIYPVPGQNDRTLTYNAVHERLGTHRWVIWHSLAGLIGDEMVKYRWKGSRGRALDAPKAEPIKRNDDLIDGLRYKMVRIPEQLGLPPAPEDEMSVNDPRRRLLKAALKQISRRGRNARGRTGGVW